MRGNASFETPLHDLKEALEELDFVLVEAANPAACDLPGSNLAVQSPRSFESPLDGFAPKRFRMSARPVSVRLFAMFCFDLGRAESLGQGSRRRWETARAPWKDAVAMAGWLSFRTSSSFRLPAEEDWRSAAAFDRARFGRAGGNCFDPKSYRPGAGFHLIEKA